MNNKLLFTLTFIIIIIVVLICKDLASSILVISLLTNYFVINTSLINLDNAECNTCPDKKMKKVPVKELYNSESFIELIDGRDIIEDPLGSKQNRTNRLPHQKTTLKKKLRLRERFEDEETNPLDASPENKAVKESPKEKIYDPMTSCYVNIEDENLNDMYDINRHKRRTDIHIHKDRVGFTNHDIDTINADQTRHRERRARSLRGAINTDANYASYFYEDDLENREKVRWWGEDDF